jgi:hypothetical protein
MSVSRLHLAALNPDTGAVHTWNPSANSTKGVHAFGTSPQHLAAGGDFTRIGGVTRQGFAQFSVEP